MFKKIGLILFTLCVFSSTIFGADIVPNAKSAILVEYTSGKVLFAKNENEKLYPASMTKMMSMYLVLEAINNNELRWDDIVSVSEHASKIGGSQIWLKPFEQMSVYDLFKSVAIASANDAITALAERVYVSEENFVNEMNEKAKEWGLTGTNFMNCHGLHDPNHYSTAADMAVIAQHLISEGGPKLFEFTTMYDSYIREGSEAEVWLVNTNKLLRTFEGTDGLKTGYTPDAGYCITLTTKRNDLRVVGVVMKEPTNTIRDQEIKKLMEYGLGLYKPTTMFSENSVVDTIKVKQAKPKSVEVYVKSDCKSIALNGNEEKQPTTNITINDIVLPLAKNSEIGRVDLISIDGVKTSCMLYNKVELLPLDYMDYLKESFQNFLY